MKSCGMLHRGGAPILRRGMIELKRWIKTGLLHRRPAWPGKEDLTRPPASPSTPVRRGSPLVCIVIPVHNRRKLTLECLNGLRWCAGEPDWKIILVDDASTDGTGDAVRSLHPHVEIVLGDGNLFWTGAMRMGMRRGLELGCTEFIWLNDDTSPDEKSLRRIAGLVRSNPHQLIASMALLDGRPSACCSMQRKTVLPVPGTLQAADVLAGYQVAFSASVVSRIGLPDSRRWPHYGGDSSFTRMAYNAGYQLAVDGDSFVSLSDVSPNDDVAGAFWKNRESLRKRIMRIFFAKRSRYRLGSLWHLDCLYRGTTQALMVFPARLAVMFWKIIRYKQRSSAPSQSECASPL